MGDGGKAFRMSKDKQTFVDPESGEEIESTWLARGVVGWFLGGPLLPVVLPFFVLVVWLAKWPVPFVLLFVLLFVLFIRRKVSTVEKARKARFFSVLSLQQIHDHIARHQHRRRILRSKDDQDVPDTAMLTFVDPETDQEIESTRLARSGAWVMTVGVMGLVIGLVSGWILGVLLEWAGGGKLGFGMLIGLLLGVGLRICMISEHIEKMPDHAPLRRIHDPIARYQHRRRILRSQEDQHVPDTALSRSQPPGEPQATDAALSLADTTDGAAHLTVEVEEDITDTLVDDSA